MRALRDIPTMQRWEILRRAKHALSAAEVAAATTAPIDAAQQMVGWHVIVARPYDEAAGSLAALLEQAPGEMLLGGYLSTVRVDVASRYGRWSNAQGAVVPL